MLDRMEEDVNLDMQMKIEQMMSVKKQKDQKVMRNNPPKKEVHLKDSKDKSEEVKFSYKSGKFGPTPQDLVK